MSIELKPCPFCGYEAAEIESGDRFYVACQSISCWAALGEVWNGQCEPEHAYATADEAITAWNTRAPVADQPVDYTQLRKDIYADIWDNLRTADHAGSVDDRCRKLTDRIMLYVKGQIALSSPVRESVDDEKGKAVIKAYRDGFLSAQSCLWQSIETAPRDGTEILAAWKYDHAPKRIFQGFIAWGFCGYAQNHCWLTHGGEGDSMHKDAKLLGWMPKPSTTSIEGEQP